ncbi:MAG: hypothetical protein IJY02_01265, partial [Oscillospiraceae bacterium]|nr:hypothetical protein [Oscillospiraceae bacterium]
YKKLAYYKEHPTFRYDSVYKENEYKILGVFLVTANDPEFLYHNMIDLDEAELTEFVNQVRARSLINTKIDVKTTDKLVTLSTCDYSFKDAQGNRVARFVVVGRAIRDGEDPTVDTSVATLNANPVMPAEWYEQIKRNQEAAELAAAESAAQEALDSVDPENISAWLTQEEIDAYLADGYTEEDLWYFADERRYELLEWLTEAEMTSLTAAEKLSAMYARRDKLWLAEEDHSLTEAEKREKIAANQAAAAILSPEELAKCRSWNEIQKAMKKKLESMCETQGCTLPRATRACTATRPPVTPPAAPCPRATAACTATRLPVTPPAAPCPRATAVCTATRLPATPLAAPCPRATPESTATSVRQRAAPLPRDTKDRTAIRHLLPRRPIPKPPGRIRPALNLPPAVANHLPVLRALPAEEKLPAEAKPHPAAPKLLPWRFRTILRMRNIFAQKTGMARWPCLFFCAARPCFPQSKKTPPFFGYSVNRLLPR